MRKVSFLFAICLLVVFCVPAFAGYSYSIEVTPLYSPTGTLINFPYTVWGTNANFKTISNGGLVTNPSGYDIVVASNSLCTSMYAFARLYWNASTGALQLKVRIPAYSSSSKVYVCVGNPAITTDQAAPATVCSSASIDEMVSFGGGGTIDNIDYCGNHTTSSVLSATTGQVEGGVSVPGNDSFGLGKNGGFALSSGGTVEVWLNPSSVSSLQIPIYLNDGPTTYCIFGWGSAANMIHTCFANDAAHSVQATASMATGWHHIAVQNSSTVATKIFLDGVDVTTPASGANHWGYNGQAWLLGSEPSGAFGFAGPADEFKLYTTQVSAAWIAAEYNTELAASTFGSPVFIGSSVVHHRVIGGQ